MIEALGLEVAAIRKRGSGSRIELHDGERVGQNAGQWLYRFILAQDVNLRDDSPISVTVDDEEVTGLLISMRDGILVIALERDMGPKILLARLVADSSFLIERLKQRLEKVRDGEVHFNRAAGDRALGLSPPRSGNSEPGPTGEQDSIAPNHEQMQAVRRSLGSDMTYVWGPPGTGKTTTLARIVEAHYRAGRSVLLVSNTNVAVDTVLERVAERLRSDPGLEEGLVLRQGPIVKEELRQRFSPYVTLEGVTDRLGKTLLAKKRQLQDELATLEAQERAFVSMLGDIDLREHVEKSLTEQEADLATARSSAAVSSRRAHEQRALEAKLRADLQRATTMGALHRFLTGLRVGRLKRWLAEADRLADAHENAARDFAADVAAREGAVAAVRSELARLRRSTREYPAGSAIQPLLAVVRTSLNHTRKLLVSLDHELAALEGAILAKCRILASTVYRTYIGRGVSRQFDVVIVDEASMLMPPLVYYAAGLATQSVTVAGDFRQLPPIVSSNEPIAEAWLKCDVFEKARIPEQLERSHSTPHLVALRTQYRMREPICALINDIFYADHPLWSDKSVARSSDAFPLSSSPLSYVDTSAFHPWAALRIGTYSRYNVFHALLIRNIVLHLAQSHYLPELGVPNDALGVITPYAAQAHLIQTLLQDSLGERAAGVAATVHRFQGNEKLAMILDLTDSSGAALGQFLRATHNTEDGARLMNVAASRARHHVVVVANFDYLRAKTSCTSIVRRFIDHFEKRGEALDLNKLLPLSERDWIDGLDRAVATSADLPAQASGVFTEFTFYPAFQQDILRASQSIIIFSPFVTRRGVGRWSNSLRSALSRRVQVRVVTRPPEAAAVGASAASGDAVAALRDLGVTVDLRADMHQKIAILDGQILWHGSLNVLSHRDTHESMLRIVSASACNKVAQFTSIVRRHERDTVPLGNKENPDCPKCGAPTAWKVGRYGAYFECVNRNCEGKVRANRSGRSGATSVDRPKATPNQPCPNSGCGGRLLLRNGRHGPFLGCSNFPSCRYTESAA
ncbi:MAG TPA: AAA domain-containing protein [Propionibacteriaceae bacterium]|jgi:Superfamily I DNA and RNA helicases and helicase subunits